MTLSKESIQQYNEFKKLIDNWVANELDSYLEQMEINRSSYREHVINHYISGENLEVETESAACGRGCCGTEGRQYSIPLECLYDEDFRKQYVIKTKEEILAQRAEEQRQADLKEKERLEVAIKMEMAQYEKLKQKFEGKV